MNFVPARFVDVGVLDPELFHATYAGIAQARQPDAMPVVMWGRARPHVSLGQSQDREAELARALDVPVVTRPLGGGAVWLDELQYCFVLIAPLARAPARPADWFEWGLGPAIATYRRFDLAVERREQDLWFSGRKIAGSGAATIGRSAVFASSFLLRFPVERFARCIAGPSPEFREWLEAGLRCAMTDWVSHRPLPAAAALRKAFRDSVEREIGWRLADARLTASELQAREEALAELAELGQVRGRRLVAGGIKLNAVAFLTERSDGGRVVRELTVDRRVVRREYTVA
ncbi:MAG: lipoate--protein ligase family protein [Betaproteobacteria bacterium]|nr:lipoate--protein ligase family protein [Betaproteobacteria bacterium]